MKYTSQHTWSLVGIWLCIGLIFSLGPAEIQHDFEALDPNHHQHDCSPCHLLHGIAHDQPYDFTLAAQSPCLTLPQPTLRGFQEVKASFARAPPYVTFT